MPEKKQENQTAATSSAPPAATPPAATPPARPQKQFDAALVDPHDPTLLHWPRHRVTVDAAELADLPAEESDPRDGESSEAAQKRIAFALAEIERDRAIFAYNESFGLTHDKKMLRYDVESAENGSKAPTLPDAWQHHTHPEKGAPYFRGARHKQHTADQAARAAAHVKGVGHPEK